MITPDPRALVNILSDAPRPNPLPSLLRAALTSHCATTGDTWRDVATRAGITLPQLSRACREGSNPDFGKTVAPVLEALGLRVDLVPLLDPPRSSV